MLDTDSGVSGDAVRSSERGAISRPRRRTQKERSAETRELLLEVTVACLAELGYVGTTSKEVADRAGLSRGAQLHHFGTKAQLVTEALEHLFERRLRDFKRGFARLPDGSDRPGAALRLLWSMMSGPSGYAYLELVCAARTDPELRAAIVELNTRMDERIDELFSDLFVGVEGTDSDFEVAWTAIFALFEGLALERVLREGDDRIERAVEALERFAPLLLQAKPLPPVKGS